MTAPFFLLLAVAISVVGCLVVYLRQRPAPSVESGIDTFRREMDALAARTGPDADRPAAPRHRARKR
ncbi:MAG: hypothetical protein ACRD2C_20735 [Acidimicrobiales bacterium]